MIHAVPLVLTQHVVFEEIGRFAGATSYIHVALHLNLHDLQGLLDNYAAQMNIRMPSLKNVDKEQLWIKATLIPEKHSDLFQLELSYLFNGHELRSLSTCQPSHDVLHSNSSPFSLSSNPPAPDIKLQNMSTH